MSSMLREGLGNCFIFPAPEPSYGYQSYKRHLCFIPWNAVISPDRSTEDKWSDGIPCLWFPAPKAASVILFFHANAEDLGMSFAVLKHMRDQFKVNVMAVEYPGYGLLRGMASGEAALYEVALTAFRFLIDEMGVRYSQIILFGRSLGSGPAVYLAAQYPVGGLILVSAIASVRAAVQSIVGRLLAVAFDERFPNSRSIANVSCPTLFIHGEADSLIPPDHSMRLFRRCRARKLLIMPKKMEHNSNLFGDAAYLAVPAIHFFGFPGYHTSNPPRIPASLFENFLKSKQAPGRGSGSGLRVWLCDCLAKTDHDHVDVGIVRPDSVAAEDMTVRAVDGCAGDEDDFLGSIKQKQPDSEAAVAPEPEQREPPGEQQGRAQEGTQAAPAPEPDSDRQPGSSSTDRFVEVVAESDKELGVKAVTRSPSKEFASPSKVDALDIAARAKARLSRGNSGVSSNSGSCPA